MFVSQSQGIPYKSRTPCSKPFRQVLTGHTGPVTSLCLTDSLLYSGSWDCTVRCWSRAGGVLSCVNVLTYDDWWVQYSTVRVSHRCVMHETRGSYRDSPLRDARIKRLILWISVTRPALMLLGNIECKAKREGHKTPVSAFAASDSALLESNCETSWAEHVLKSYCVNKH